MSSRNFLGCKTRFSESLLTTVGSDLKGTHSDALGLLGSNTGVVTTKNDFFSEEISLGSAGTLMTARGKMIP